MAQATSYNLSNDPHGVRQDIKDIVRRVEPEKTPMYSLLPQTDAPKATVVEWINDDLPEVDFANPLADGTDITLADTTNELANRVRVGNRIQQFQLQGSVSPIAELLDVAGEPNLLAQSKSRILVQLKKNIDAAIGSAQVPAAGSSSVGDKLGGIFHIGDPAATNGIWDTAAKRNYRSVAGSRWDQAGGANGTLTEAGFRSILENLYIASGVDSTYRMFAGPSLLNSVTGFSRALNVVGGNQSRFNANIQGTTLTLSVVELVTDFGKVVCIPSLNLNRTSGAAPTTVSKRSGVLIPEGDIASLAQMGGGISVQDLPESGGGPRFLTRSILTLCVKNARAIGTIV